MTKQSFRDALGVAFATTSALASMGAAICFFVMYPSILMGVVSFVWITVVLAALGAFVFRD